MKSLIPAVILTLIVALPCYSQEMRAKEVKGKEVVIEDTKTKKETKATEGDVIEGGWKVIEVTDGLVTVEKEVKPGDKVRGQMPVGGSKRIVPKRKN